MRKSIIKIIDSRFKGNQKLQTVNRTKALLKSMNCTRSIEWLHLIFASWLLLFFLFYFNKNISFVPFPLEFVCIILFIDARQLHKMKGKNDPNEMHWLLSIKCIFVVAIFRISVVRSSFSESFWLFWRLSIIAMSKWFSFNPLNDEVIQIWIIFAFRSQFSWLLGSVSPCYRICRYTFINVIYTEKSTFSHRLIYQTVYLMSILFVETTFSLCLFLLSHWSVSHGAAGWQFRHIDNADIFVVFFN